MSYSNISSQTIVVLQHTPLRSTPKKRTHYFVLHYKGMCALQTREHKLWTENVNIIKIEEHEPQYGHTRTHEFWCRRLSSSVSPLTENTSSIKIRQRLQSALESTSSTGSEQIVLNWQAGGHKLRQRQGGTS